MNEKEMNDPRDRAMFKRFWQSTNSSLNISQDYYDLAKRSVRFNGIKYHIFKQTT